MHALQGKILDYFKCVYCLLSIGYMYIFLNHVIICFNLFFLKACS